MLKEGVGVILGCVLGVYMYNSTKQYSFNHVTHLDAHNKTLTMSVQGRYNNTVVYVCGENVPHEKCFKKWAQYRIRHPVVGKLIWGIHGLPNASVYRIH